MCASLEARFHLPSKSGAIINEAANAASLFAKHFKSPSCFPSRPFRYRPIVDDRSAGGALANSTLRLAGNRDG